MRIFTCVLRSPWCVGIIMAEDIRGILRQARDANVAVGAFNILNHLTALAAVRVAGELNLPVILQTSVATVKKYGVSLLGDMLYPLKELSRQPVILHLDHCRDPELAKACITHKWDSVMLDASHLPFKENIAVTGEIVRYAHNAGKQAEGELGVIAGVEDDIAADEGSCVNVEQALRYIEETGVDLFAPAIGTAHGEYKGIPKINYDLVAELDSSTDCPIVVHGGTGLSEEVFHGLIKRGASKINVSTAIKNAYVEAVSRCTGLKNPLEIDEIIIETVGETVRGHMKIFTFI